MSAPKDPEKRKLWKKRLRIALSGENGPNWGKNVSKETRQKLSESQQGEKNSFFGRKHSLATREKWSRSRQGKGNVMYGKHHAKEAKNKIREAKIGENHPNWNKHLPVITREKISEANRGEKNWNYGKSIPREVKLKIRKATLGSKNHFFGKCHSEITKQKISKSRQGLTSGQKHPNWKGGISPLAKLIRSQVIYKLWIKAIFIRDHFQCQDCGKIGGYLEAHHRYPFAQLLKDYEIISVGQAVRTEELWDISNGVTLCKKCHKKRKKIKSKLKAD